MDIGMGAAILIIGSLATYLVTVLFNSAEFGIAFAVVFLAAVIAAKPTESKPMK